MAETAEIKRKKKTKQEIQKLPQRKVGQNRKTNLLVEAEESRLFLILQKGLKLQNMVEHQHLNLLQ